LAALDRPAKNAKLDLESGFTTARDLSSGGTADVDLRTAINAGIVPGPRIFTAGKAIGSTGGHADPTDGYRQDLAKDLGAINAGVVALYSTHRQEEAL